jgi:cytochrome c oxidase subunit III
VEGQADPAEVAAGGGGEAETQTESKTRLVTADLPRKEQSVVSPPAAPSNGVNAAFLTGTTPGGEHNTYSYAQLPEIEQKRMHFFFQIYYLMTGLHGIHVLVGMGLIGWLIVRAFGGAFSSVSFTAVDVVGLYWHLVDLIWIFLFPLLYLIH